MKRETLQKRIEKHLYTKKGTLAKKYEDVFYLLMHPEEVMRPVYWSNRGRSLHDSSANLEEGLKLLGIDFETGNYTPRWGKDGYFVKLTQKGKRQVSEFSKVLIIHKGVTEIDKWAFSGCENLKSITIPKGVKRIGKHAFSYCRWLASVTISDSVTEISEFAFAGCESLTSVTIPDSVTEIGDWAFSGCRWLASVTIPDSVIRIGDFAFYACDRLQSVTIPQGCQYDERAFDKGVEVIIR